MNKLKTSKSIGKRFKITARSKLLRRKAMRNHLLEKKTSKRKQDLRCVVQVNVKDMVSLKRKLSYFI